MRTRINSNRLGSDFSLLASFFVGAFLVLLGVTELLAESYSYDELNRVTRVEHDSGTIIQYIYDEAGNRTQKLILTPAPQLTLIPPPEQKEGDIFTIQGYIDDPDSISWTGDANFGDGVVESLTIGSDGAFQVSHNYADNGIYTVTVDVVDESNNLGSASVDVSVSNVAPVIGNILVDTPLIAVLDNIHISATFTDAGTADTHEAVIDWGDGSQVSANVTEADGSGTATGEHAYSVPGVYTITVTVTDDDGGETSAVYSYYIVVYDADAGFVTGGGFIESPAGAYVPDPTLSGKASFGFSAKYKKGQSIPDGQTQFNFQAGSFNFHSTVYDWLVVAGARAQFKGTGKVNGEGTYGFLLTAIDGELPGGGGIDKFRIKIWDKASDTIIYDNQSGDDDEAELMAIAGGSIVIHAIKSK